VRAAVAADPDAMLVGLPEPVVIDEWQEAPDVLGAVKRAVDDDPRPGRFILTGYVRAELENRVWPGTGRILQVPMYGLSVRERRGLISGATLLDRIVAEGVSAVLAVNSAGLVTEESLRGAAGINAGTAREYQALFQRMFVLDIVPAWFSNRIKRLVKTPKRYLVDPALVAAVLGLGREAILYGPDMLGRLMDTFVAAQLRSELAVSRLGPRLYHLRDEHGRREVDLVVETASGKLIGIEVKASATVTTSDARHLAWLRDESGDAFAAGIVLHTGPHVFPLGDRLIAAPVSALWA
jgi:predicted AAA+ superfamily ATPase